MTISDIRTKEALRKRQIQKCICVLITLFFLIGGSWASLYLTKLSEEERRQDRYQALWQKIQNKNFTSEYCPQTK